MKKGLIFTILLILVLIAASVTFILKNYVILTASEIIIKDSLVSSGHGLYADTLETGLDVTKPFSSKYYFKGEMIDNYIIFEDICWQIINIAQNDTIKIMYLGRSNNNQCIEVDNETIKQIEWNKDSENTWSKSSMNTYLEALVNANRVNIKSLVDFTSEESKIAEATWYIGGVRFISQSLSTDIKQERQNNMITEQSEPVYQGKMGLITVSDYLKVSCEMGAYDSTEVCKNNNFLTRENSYWTLTATDSGKLNSWAVKNDGSLISVATNETDYSIFPVVYLKSDIKITGNGSISHPYIVVE